MTKDLDQKIIELMDLFDDERIPFDNGGSALKQKYLKEDYDYASGGIARMLGE